MSEFVDLKNACPYGCRDLDDLFGLIMEWCPVHGSGQHDPLGLVQDSKEAGA